MSALLKPIEVQDDLIVVAAPKARTAAPAAIVAHPLRASAVATKLRQAHQRRRRMAAIASGATDDLMLIR
jgi:hypothetical protein